MGIYISEFFLEVFRYFYTFRIYNYNFRDNYYNDIFHLEYDIYNYQISHNHQEQIFKVSIIYSLLG
jgi:hypothetical protein